jgi:hypothetical protein
MQRRRKAHLSRVLLQVIKVFGSAAGQFVSLEISQADNHHLNSFSAGSAWDGGCVFWNHAH